VLYLPYLAAVLSQYCHSWRGERLRYARGNANERGSGLLAKQSQFKLNASYRADKTIIAQLNGLAATILVAGRPNNNNAVCLSPAILKSDSLVMPEKNSQTGTKGSHWFDAWVLRACKICCVLVSLACIGIDAAPSPAEDDAMHYRYWDWGKTPKRDDYQFAALELALQRSQEQFGSYTLKRVVVAYSTARVRREINRGEVVNVRAGPWVSAGESRAAGMELNHAVNIPIMHNLLGYRELTVRASDLERIRKITTLEQLRELVIGLGRGWQDVAIYRANGFLVNDRSGPNNMLAMLLGKRFDALPMGIIETEAILGQNPAVREQLAVVDTVNIYYPFPLIFYASLEQPKMAERIGVGLKVALANGELEKLFHKVFREEVKAIRESNSRYFVLKNPFIPDELVIPEPLLRNRR